MERLYIKKIEGGMRGLRLGTKTPETCQCGKYLNKLKPLNEGMWEDLMVKYSKELEAYKKKNENVY